MNHSVARVCLALIALLSFASCQVGKKPVRRNLTIERNVIKERYGLNTVDTVVRTVSKPADSVIISGEQKKELVNTLHELSEKEIPFTTFSGKAKMHYASGEDKQEFVSHIRIKKDSVIWINVTALAGTIPVARILITPDSIRLVNYLQKEVRLLQIADVSKLLPVSVDFKALQNLILGNVLKKGANIVDVGDFGGTWTMQVEDSEMRQQLSYNKADSSIRTMQMRTTDEKTEGMMQYGAYELTGNRMFSTQRVITINNAGAYHYLDMNFNKTEFDQDLDYPFSIPKKYDIKQ